MLAIDVLMLLAVVLGAFGAHALQAVLTPRQLASYQTGVTYHLFHALALVVLGGLAQVTRPTPWISRAGSLLVVGIVPIYSILSRATRGNPLTLAFIERLPLVEVRE